MTQRDRVRLDERRVFGTIKFLDNTEVSGTFWMTRGEGDLQGQLGAILTDGENFYPLGAVKSFSLL